MPQLRLKNWFVLPFIIHTTFLGVLFYYGHPVLTPLHAPPEIEINPARPRQTGILSFSGRTTASVNQKQQLIIKADTGGSVLSEITAIVHFPTEKLEVLNLSVDSTTCTQVKEQRVDAANGILTITCQTPSSAFTNQIVTVGTIEYQAKTTGPAKFSFDQEKAVLKDAANPPADILQNLQDITIIII